MGKCKMCGDKTENPEFCDDCMEAEEMGLDTCHKSKDSKFYTSGDAEP